MRRWSQSCASTHPYGSGVYGEVQAFSNAIKARISSTGTIVR